MLQATKVVAATLDGDDSVALVEVVLRGNASTQPNKAPSEMSATSGVQNSGKGGPAAAPAEVAAAPVAPEETADACTPLQGLLAKLAVPVVIVLAAAGLIWHRIRRGRKRKSALSG